MDDATGMIAGPGSAHAAPQDGSAAVTSDQARTSRPGASANGRDVHADALTANGPAPAPAREHDDATPPVPPEEANTPQADWSTSPGFRERGRMRRRLAFLCRARELAYRDLGGLVFNLHRFGQRHDDLVLAKLGVLERLDTELRALEAALAERRAATVLRVAGITACPRCAAIHASEDRFCPNCGLPMGRHADLPIAGPPVAAATAASGPSTEQTASHALTASGAPGSADGGAAPTGAPAAALPSAPASTDEPTEILRPPFNGQ